ncbi:uncharacterized protein LOC144637198 isoform X2 [Oculina patagonica]
MNSKTRKASKSGGMRSRDSTLFGTTKKNTIATYSKNRPVQIAKNCHFLTPDTPEDWISYSNETNSKQGTSRKSSMLQNTPSVRRGSSLALRNISNIPFKKTLGGTPCAQANQQSRLSSKGFYRRLNPGGLLPTKVSASDDKECKIYQTELQRNNNSKKTSSKKSKVLVPTTTYSTKSMSCCSVCRNVTCSHGHSLSTIKSMSLCHSLPGGDILDDLSLDDVGGNDESQVLQPHNSTLVEEDCNVELKDIIPHDLSAILEEPVEDEQSEPPKKSKIDTEIYKIYQGEASSSACYPRCSTRTDLGLKIQSLDSAALDVSPITANAKICVIPVEIKSTDLKKIVYQELNTIEADEPDITPEAVSNKECTNAAVEPKQKRKLAYCGDKDKVPDCILLDIMNNKKRPVKSLFKQDNSSRCCLSNLPVDILIHESNHHRLQ